MLKDQDFPISLEVQLLGGLSDGQKRTTANLCTPGTNVVMDGKLITTHCINSTSKTYDGDQWVRVEAEVHGDELVRHIVEGQTVLEYSKPQIGGGQVAPVDPAVKIDGTLLTGGFISIQAETAPADFRKIELLNLEGCMDRTSPKQPLRQGESSSLPGKQPALLLPFLRGLGRLGLLRRGPGSPSARLSRRASAEAAASGAGR